MEGFRGTPLISVSVSAELLQAAVHRGEQEAAPGDPRMVDAVQQVPVEVVAELGQIQLGLRQVLELRVGQVLRLTTAVDDPVIIHVAGLKKLYGVPVVSRGQLSVEIRGRCDE